MIKIKVNDIAYHRNGIAGTGFWAMLFEYEDGGHFVATVFPEPGHVAVLGIGLLDEGIIGEGNKWRGNDFEPQLRAAIEEYLGPFSSPA